MCKIDLWVDEGGGSKKMAINDVFLPRLTANSKSVFKRSQGRREKLEDE